MKLTNDRGDVHIRQSTGLPSMPAPPQAPKPPSAPGLQRGAVPSGVDTAVVSDQGAYRIYQGSPRLVVGPLPKLAGWRWQCDRNRDIL